MSNVFEFPSNEPKQTPAWEALRAFADLLEEFNDDTIEVAGVALIQGVGVALCGNSATGNDGLNTMLDIGKTAIIMQYIGEEDYDGTIH